MADINAGRRQGVSVSSLMRRLLILGLELSNEELQIGASVRKPVGATMIATHAEAKDTLEPSTESETGAGSLFLELQDIVKRLDIGIPKFIQDIDNTNRQALVRFYHNGTIPDGEAGETLVQSVKKWISTIQSSS